MASLYLAYSIFRLKWLTFLNDVQFGYLQLLLITYLGVMYIKMLIKKVKCAHNPKRIASKSWKLLWRWITLKFKINFKSHFLRKKWQPREYSLLIFEFYLSEKPRCTRNTPRYARTWNHLKIRDVRNPR